ncbi:MAG: zf-HC2 domain-containing protein [Acidimicrobiia bacterium]|nr:zf-HC2 domain-containing protein [Acidimicrobiia bacterium]
MNCMQVGRRLQRYLDGEVDDLTARRILRHLEDCRRCGLEVVAYTAIKASLARRDDVPSDVLVRLRQFAEQLLREGPPPEEDAAGGTAGT